MDWILQQKFDQLCNENNCNVAYSKGGYKAFATVYYIMEIGDLMLMSEKERLEYELEIYAFEFTGPWRDLEAKIVEFATACSLKYCFKNG